MNRFAASATLSPRLVLLADELQRRRKQRRACAHTWALTRRHAAFSWLACTRCDCRKLEFHEPSEDVLLILDKI